MAPRRFIRGEIKGGINDRELLAVCLSFPWTGAVQPGIDWRKPLVFCTAMTSWQLIPRSSKSTAPQRRTAYGETLKPTPVGCAPAGFAGVKLRIRVGNTFSTRK